MRPPTTDELIVLLASDNPQMIKRGLQWICDSIEAGRRVDLNRDLRLARLVSVLKRSDDVFVRRWLYKLVGLLRVRAWSAWLGGTEVISHAVNWAARVMNAAAGNQVLVSDPYYWTIVKPSADEMPEATFRYVAGLSTKHDEPLPVWEAINS